MSEVGEGGDEVEDERVVVLILVCEEVLVLALADVSYSPRIGFAVASVVVEVVAVKEDVEQSQGRF